MMTITGLLNERIRCHMFNYGRHLMDIGLFSFYLPGIHCSIKKSRIGIASCLDVTSFIVKAVEKFVVNTTGTNDL